MYHERRKKGQHGEDREYGKKSRKYDIDQEHKKRKHSTRPDSNDSHPSHSGTRKMHDSYANIKGRYNSDKEESDHRTKRWVLILSNFILIQKLSV